MDVDDNEGQRRDLLNETTTSKDKIRQNIFVPSLILFLICLICGAPAFCSENIIPMQNVIVEHMKLSELQYNAISSFYSIPNIIFVIISGVVVDKVGHRLSTLLFLSCSFTGQLFVCLGVLYNCFSLLLFGRLVFGIGAEALQIAVTKYLILWFGGFSLNLSFGILVASMRLLYFVNMKYSDSLYHFMLKKFIAFSPLTASAAVLSIGVFICLISLWLCCVLGLVDKKYHSNTTSPQENSQPPPIEVSNFTKIKSMTPTFWILVAFSFIFYQPFSSYNSISPLYFQLKYDYTTHSANSVLSTISFASILLSITFGYITGTVGLDALWVVLGALLCLIGHAVHSVNFISPYYIMLIRALCSTIVGCSFWPSIKLIVTQNSVGIAYGIIQSVQNLGLSISPMIIGFLLDNLGYYYVELYIQFCLSIALTIAFFIKFVDEKTTRGILFMTDKERSRYALGQDYTYIRE